MRRFFGDGGAPLRALGAGFALTALALCALPAAAQQPAARDTARAVAPVAARDMARVAVADSVQGVSPRGAFLRSLVLPGWGQSAVGSPGRGAVYFGMEAGSLWMWHKSRAKLRDARAVERQLREEGTLDLRENTKTVASREGQVEDWATISIFLLLFSAADAFVAAHLADFDERVGAGPAPTGGVSLRLSVPVGGRP